MLRATGPDTSGHITEDGSEDFILLDADAPHLSPEIDGYGLSVHSDLAANVSMMGGDGEIPMRDAT